MSTRRKLARPGLSYFDANSGRLVTETAEVLDMKAKIRASWPNLDVAFDDVDKKFIVIQHCEDGVERCFMVRDYCDDRLMMDIAKADPTNRNYVDPEKAVDDHNASVERQRDRELEDISGDFGERFIHALRKDGFMNHETITRRRRKPELARRAIRVGKRP